LWIRITAPTQKTRKTFNKMMICLFLIKNPSMAVAMLGFIENYNMGKLGLKGIFIYNDSLYVFICQGQIQRLGHSIVF